MTLSDPLLKELKGYISLIIQNGPTEDLLEEHSDLIFTLCHCLESIFTKGLIRHDGFSPWKTDAFQWFYQLVRKYQKVIPLEFKIIFDQVLANTKTKTSIGKTRLLIRTCLKKKCLHIPIQFHLENQDYLNPNLHINYYNSIKSILGHEILLQIFYSLVQQLSFFTFSFDLTNCSFLDESWQLPTIVRTEMVPCRQLGLTLGFPMGFAVIVQILENSCADELRNIIGIGDILDEMNGINVRGLYGSKIDELFKKIRSQPFKLTFIKGRNSKTVQIYLPVIKLYRILGLDPLCLGSNNTDAEEEEYLQSPFGPPYNIQHHKGEDINKQVENNKDKIVKSGSIGKLSTTKPQNDDGNKVDDEIKDLMECSSTTNTNNDSTSSKTNLIQNDSPSTSSTSSSSSSSSCNNTCPQQSKPYPPSQQSQLNNNSSASSALNLQMYNPDADQLIV